MNSLRRLISAVPIQSLNQWLFTAITHLCSAARSHPLPILVVISAIILTFLALDRTADPQEIIGAWEQTDPPPLAFVRGPNYQRFRQTLDALSLRVKDGPAKVWGEDLRRRRPRPLRLEISRFKTRWRPSTMPPFLHVYPELYVNLHAVNHFMSGCRSGWFHSLRLDSRGATKTLIGFGGDGPNPDTQAQDLLKSLRQGVIWRLDHDVLTLTETGRSPRSCRFKRHVPDTRLKTLLLHPNFP